jgi:hypothetical protein
MNWISLEEHLPEPEEIIILADYINEIVSLGRMREDDENMYFEFMGLEDMQNDCVATHWMPLPTISM